MTYYEDMSKTKANLLYIFLICIMLFTANFFAFQNQVCLAESASFRVCVSDCAIFASPNSSLTDNILEIKSYNEILKINDTLIEDLADSSNLKFYEVLDADNNIIGYVLSSAVVLNNEHELSVKLQTNAKLNKQSEIYTLKDNEYVKLNIDGTDIVLQENTEIKMLEKYDKNKTYTQISFYHNNEIVTGYVLTKNIQVSGFNYYFLIAIFLIVIIASTVIPIVVKNWKKKKKLADG